MKIERNLSIVCVCARVQGSYHQKCIHSIYTQVYTHFSAQAARERHILEFAISCAPPSLTMDVIINYNHMEANHTKDEYKKEKRQKNEHTPKRQRKTTTENRDTHCYVWNVKITAKIDMGLKLLDVCVTYTNRLAQHPTYIVIMCLCV